MNEIKEGRGINMKEDDYIIMIWTEYIKELYVWERAESTEQNNLERPSILKEEVTDAKVTDAINIWRKEKLLGQTESRQRNYKYWDFPWM